MKLYRYSLVENGDEIKLSCKEVKAVEFCGWLIVDKGKGQKPEVIDPNGIEETRSYFSDILLREKDDALAKKLLAECKRKAMNDYGRYFREAFKAYERIRGMRGEKE